MAPTRTIASGSIGRAASFREEYQVRVEQARSTVAVNPDQATVEGVLMATQIDTLPINGRNFLDLAQLEPGMALLRKAVFLSLNTAIRWN
jgi:hypothetical protein